MHLQGFDDYGAAAALWGASDTGIRSSPDAQWIGFLSGWGGRPFPIGESAWSITRLLREIAEDYVSDGRAIAPIAASTSSVQLRPFNSCAANPASVPKRRLKLRTLGAEFVALDFCHACSRCSF